MTKQFSISRRPRRLEDVIGHKKIIAEMKKRSIDHNWPQAMMFQGFTGTGKTTLGFIVSSLINCANPQKMEDGYYEPCGECSSCKSIIHETFNQSVYFYDCSTMGKDDVIGLESVVSSSSLFPGQKTVLILEEAQQLASAGARGALLKLLEKPRNDVHFILLTMDEKKFDKAIRDRCQVYRFKKLTDTEISDYIFSILEEVDPNEKIPETFIDEVIPVLVQGVQGSLRKALEDFERCLYSEIYTRSEAVSELGLTDEKTMYEVLDLIVYKDPNAFSKIREIEDLLLFYNYTWKILTNILVAEIEGYDSDWKERRAKKIIASGNLQNLILAYKQVHESNTGYFNPSLFYFYLTEFYNGRKLNYNISREGDSSTVTTKAPRKVRTPKK